MFTKIVTTAKDLGCVLANSFEGCASLTFDNVEVPVGNTVGEVNRGFRLIMTCE